MNVIPNPVEDAMEHAMIVGLDAESEKKLCQRLLGYYQNLKPQRSNLESIWSQIAEHVLPDASHIRDNPNLGGNLHGSWLKHSFYSGIGGKIHQIVSTLASQMIDPTMEWCRLAVPYGLKQLGGRPGKALREWLEGCQEAIYDWSYHHESGFYNELYSFVQDWYIFGNGCQEIRLRGATGMPTVSTIGPREMYVMRGAFGNISGMFRVYDLTPREAYERWGEGISGAKKRELLEDPLSTRNQMPNGIRGNRYVEVVLEREQSYYNEIGKKIRYSSYTIDEGECQLVEAGQELRYAPYVYSRFFQDSRWAYGRSPLMAILGELKYIKMLTLRATLAAEFKMFPMQTTFEHDDQVINKLKNNFQPSAILSNMLDVNMRPKIVPFPYVDDLQTAFTLLEKREQEILPSMIIGEAIAPMQNIRNVAEVQQRQLQDQNRMRSVITHWEKEYCGPMVMRVMQLLEESGNLPRFPYQEMGLDPIGIGDPLEFLQVHYEGQLYQQKKLLKAQQSQEFLGMVMQIAQINPEILVGIKLDNFVKDYGEGLGIGEEHFRSEEEISEIKEQMRMAAAGAEGTKE
jgi:hypothetical protein